MGLPLEDKEHDHTNISPKVECQNSTYQIYWKISGERDNNVKRHKHTHTCMHACKYNACKYKHTIRVYDYYYIKYRHSKLGHTHSKVNNTVRFI